MNIKKLQINNFRHLINTNIEFGERLTVISGQNGTGKSSILGWIAQLCDFKNPIKRLNGKQFKEDYKKVFKFCPENDHTKIYNVIFHYEDANGESKTKNLTTRLLKQSKKPADRYRIDFDGRGRAMDFPVIYLGLKRLIPLATESKITLKEFTLDNRNKNLFSLLSKEILILMDQSIVPESIKSSNKDILAMKTNRYGHVGNSAGQDNIGQIVSSILSFQKLKNELGSEYQGGIILIDEIDASLYAGSQIKLIDKLHRYATNLNLQIIFTTHSLEILEHLIPKVGNETVINHLVVRDRLVQNELNPSFKYVRNKIRNQIQQANKIEKKQLVCEDKIAEYWVKNMLNGSDLKKMVTVENGPFPDGTIISLAKSQISLFKDAGYIVDGDVKKKFKSKAVPPRVVFLPEEQRPETIMYEFVKRLSDTDSFWNDDLNFTSQTCFSNYQNSSNGNIHKKWFTDIANKKFFGAGYSKLFTRWKQDAENKVKVEKFLSDLRKII